jgi:hypothetical protein
VAIAVGATPATRIIVLSRAQVAAETNLPDLLDVPYSGQYAFLGMCASVQMSAGDEAKLQAWLAGRGPA